MRHKRKIENFHGIDSEALRVLRQIMSYNCVNCFRSTRSSVPRRNLRSAMRGKSEKTKLVPPDGGWGWVVLTSALVVNFLIPGTVKSFGVLFVEFLHVFKASSTAASWMPALCYFLYNSLGKQTKQLSLLSRYVILY